MTSSSTTNRRIRRMMTNNNNKNDGEEEDVPTTTTTVCEPEDKEKQQRQTNGGHGRRLEEMMNVAVSARLEPLRRVQRVRRRRNTCLLTLLPFCFLGTTILIHLYYVTTQQHHHHPTSTKSMLRFPNNNNSSTTHTNNANTLTNHHHHSSSNNNDTHNDDDPTNILSRRGNNNNNNNNKLRKNNHNDDDDDDEDSLLPMRMVDPSNYGDFLNTIIQNNNPIALDFKNRHVITETTTTTKKQQPSSNPKEEEEAGDASSVVLWRDDLLSKRLAANMMKNNQNQKKNMATSSNEEVPVAASSRRTSPATMFRSRLRVWPGVPIQGEIFEIQKKYRKIANYDTIRTELHTSASLHCDIYGGPTTTTTTTIHDDNPKDLEVVYWEENIPIHAAYQSPFYQEAPLLQQQQQQQLHAAADDDDNDDIIKQQQQQKIDQRHSKTKYITFEIDHNDGWNNKRMNFETMVVLSHAMGRTLVLPPKSPYSNNNNNNNNTPKNGKKLFSFDDIYHLETINREQKGIHIITMEEFLRREAVEGKLTAYNNNNNNNNDGANNNNNNNDRSIILYPPENQTNWDIMDNNNPIIDDVNTAAGNGLNDYLRKVGNVVDWNFLDCVVAFPSIPDGNANLERIMSDMLRSRDGRPYPDPLQFQGKPVPVNFPAIERLREIMGERKQLCLYTDEFQQSTLLHFPLSPTKKKDGNNNKSSQGNNGIIRSFPHFYSFLFFEDWKQDVWVKQFVRNNLRYNDEIQCAASRVIHLLRQGMGEGDGSSTYYYYDAMHFHRGMVVDNTMQSSLPSANELSNILQSKMMMTSSNHQQQYNTIPTTSTAATNRTLYISTDEDDLSFFDPLKQIYQNIYFLKDILPLIKGMDRNHYRMVEQIVAAKSDTFWGTHTSTFSGYIMRLRGYYSVKEKWDGYEEGKLIRSFYLSPKEAQNEMRIYQAVRKPFYMREFPVAWKDIHLQGMNENKWE